ncbi:hypothetical protein [Alteromonas sp. BMJM2]|uniref:hypothetical protein n=1 Tax=Alteromonas sp. BMJM2 TaxID=2954241 RepID=UPI0022B4E341|nr:hypothetical protein [Alteromonas sp. BMJM2]
MNSANTQKASRTINSLGRADALFFIAGCFDYRQPVPVKLFTENSFECKYAEEDAYTNAN